MRKERRLREKDKMHYRVQEPRWRERAREREIGSRNNDLNAASVITLFASVIAH